jgi:hypothetical protein
MVTNISLEIKGEKIKVVAPYTEEFVEQARYLHGRWRKDAWWFDNTALPIMRDMLMRMWNTTGETPYENCCLRITNYSTSARKNSVYLFNRIIAKAFGRRSGIELGPAIRFISGSCKPGGEEIEWETQLVNATFEIDNFPMPATELPEVKSAIAAGWCEVKKNPEPRDKRQVETEIEECQLRLKGLRMELSYLDY